MSTVKELESISDEALYDRSKGLTILIEKTAIEINRIHNELWRRYKTAIKELKEYKDRGY